MADQVAPTRVDSNFLCRRCKQLVYCLYQIPVPNQVGIYTHRLWPHPSQPTLGPPTNANRLQCPTCKSDLVRVDPRVDPQKEY